MGNYGNGHDVVAMAPAPGTPRHCGPGSAVKACLTAADFPAYSAAASGGTSTAFPFGGFDRNQFWGPHFFDTDMSLQKGFRFPHWSEASKLEFGATAFNLFNHPNFGLPGSVIDSSSHFGYSLYMEGPPTSIYGSGVGGDPSVRILELTGKVVF